MTIEEYFNRPNKRLTRPELLEIEERIVEINELLDLDLDEDICDNLIEEIEGYEKILLRSIKAIKIAERGLTLC